MIDAGAPSELLDVERGDIRRWRGLPRGLPLDAVAEIMPRTAAGEGRAPLGNGEALFVPLASPRLSPRFRAWHDAGEVLLLLAAAPTITESAPELLDRLGTPGSRLDYHDGTLPVPQGEWVYPEAGLALFLDEGGTTLRHLALFPNTSLEEYHGRFRPHLRTRRRPPAMSSGVDK